MRKTSRSPSSLHEAVELVFGERSVGAEHDDDDVVHAATVEQALHDVSALAELAADFASMTDCGKTL